MPLLPKRTCRHYTKLTTLSLSEFYNVLVEKLTPNTAVPEAINILLSYRVPVSSLGLPDEEGRVQILEIHTAKMREHRLLAPDVDLADLAVQTKNFTGAEIEGLVRAAQSTAMNRFIQVMQTKATV